MVQFELPDLGYDYDALEPYIDEETMKLHHDKHHQAYLDKFNVAIKGREEFEGQSAEEIVAGVEDAPEELRKKIRDHGGGFVNHKLFWKVLKKDTAFEGPIAEAIKKEFGGYDAFRQKFSEAAKGQFGSGWAWLVKDKEGNLKIMSTSNQETPISHGFKPLLTIDVWEHAYYLKYRNKRPDYIEAFFNVINWDQVNYLYTNR
ncbi:MAG: superoxide dismutase [Nanobdellota archaeon]